MSDREDLFRLACQELDIEGLLVLPFLGKNVEAVLDWCILISDTQVHDRIVKIIAALAKISDKNRQVADPSWGEADSYWRSDERKLLESCGWHEMECIANRYEDAERLYTKLPTQLTQHAWYCRYALEYLEVLQEHAQHRVPADDYQRSISWATLKKLGMHNL